MQGPAAKHIPYFALGGELGSKHINWQLITGTCHATPGTVKLFPHGLGYAPDIRFIRLGNAYVSAADATNITVLSTVANAPFELVYLTQDSQA
jgi:hypothetical protein